MAALSKTLWGSLCASFFCLSGALALAEGDDGFSRVEDRPDLSPYMGEMWLKDGVIWGALARDANGEAIALSQPEAARYCETLGTSSFLYLWHSGQALGARLPTLEEAGTAFGDAQVDTQYDYIPDSRILAWTSTPNEFTGTSSWDGTAASRQAFYLFRPYALSTDLNTVPYLPRLQTREFRCVVELLRLR